MNEGFCDDSDKNPDTTIAAAVPRDGSDFLILNAILTVATLNSVAVLGVIFAIMSRTTKRKEDVDAAQTYASAARLFFLLGLVWAIIQAALVLTIVALAGGFRSHTLGGPF
ncbi:MAG: CD225/dispanin family protein [Thermoguttaceae bacterium]|nr:CD225/dispanin family protein [Thermoguttaceae bacterium]